MLLFWCHRTRQKQQIMFDLYKRKVNSLTFCWVRFTLAPLSYRKRLYQSVVPWWSAWRSSDAAPVWLMEATAGQQQRVWSTPYMRTSTALWALRIGFQKVQGAVPVWVRKPQCVSLFPSVLSTTDAEKTVERMKLKAEEKVTGLARAAIGFLQCHSHLETLLLCYLV